LAGSRFCPPSMLIGPEPKYVIINAAPSSRELRLCWHRRRLQPRLALVGAQHAVPGPISLGPGQAIRLFSCLDFAGHLQGFQIDDGNFIFFADGNESAGAIGDDQNARRAAP
jgi:hypothetical protein